MNQTTLDQKTQDTAEKELVDDAAALSSKLLYEIIRQDGEEELRRPVPSLVWSGIAAGIMISFSVLGEAILRTHLPDTPSRFLIENLGYSLGFILVILGRMQLFTENTITTVLPGLAEPTLSMLSRILRLWLIVLFANVVGAFAAALIMAHTPAIPADLLPAITDLSKHAVEMPPLDSFWRAIPAGVLIAALVWMLAQAKETAVFVILIFTWLIAAGDFTHVVAGSVEMAFLAVTGSLGFYNAVIGFFLPVLAGNVIGGTAIFSLMVWGQVKQEVRES